MNEEEINAYISDYITNYLSISIDVTDKSTYGYGGSTEYYKEITVFLKLEGDVISTVTETI